MHQEPTIEIGKNEEALVHSVEHTTRTSPENDTAEAEIGPGTKSKRKGKKPRRWSDQKQTHLKSSRTAFWILRGSSTTPSSTSRPHKKQLLISMNPKSELAATSTSPDSATRATSTF